MRIKVADLLPETRYALELRSSDGQNVSDWSRKFEVVTVTDTVLPDVPTNVTWESVGNAFHGEWDAVTTNEEGMPVNIVRYEISLGSGINGVIQSVPQKTDGRVTFDLSYDLNRSLFGEAQATVVFSVRAVDTKGLKSPWSSVYTAANAAPNPPSTLEAVGITDGVVLEWTAPADLDIAGYNVYVGSAQSFVPSEQNKVNRELVKEASYTYRTSTYSEQWFRVVSVDSFGQESIPTAAVAGTPQSSFVLDTTDPLAPTNLVVATANEPDGRTQKATVSWSHPDIATTDPNVLAGFHLRYKESAASNWTIVDLARDASPYVHILPKSYVAYNFEIRAYDLAANKSAWVSTLKSALPNTAPAQVTGGTAAGALQTLTVSWNESTAADVRFGAGIYEVQVDTVNTFNSANLKTRRVGVTSAVFTGLNRNGSYYFRVRAIDSLGLAGSYSAIGGPIAVGSIPTDSELNSLDNRVDSVETTVSQHTGDLADITLNLNGKNKVTYSTAAPTNQTNTAGDVWFVRNATTGLATAQFEGLGGTGWRQVILTDGAVGNLSASIITTGVLDAQRVSVGGTTTFEDGYNPRVSDMDGGGKTFHNPLVFSRSGSGQDGSIVIRTPITLDNYMCSIKIIGYNYQASQGAEIDLTVSFYAYSLGTFPNSAQTSIGSLPVTARLALDAEGRVVIILDHDATTGGLWFYPKLVVTEAIISHITPPYSFADGWSGFVETDLTPYTIVETPPRRDINDTHTLTQTWRHPGTTEISGGYIRTNTVDADVILAGSAFTQDLTVKSLFTIGDPITDGNIASYDYISSGGSTGFALNSAGLVINDGSIDAKTLRAGSSIIQDLIIGGGGSIESENYSTGVSGFLISEDQIIINNGQIKGQAITTGQISSNATVDVNGTPQPSWFIDLEGDAQLGNASVRGHVVVGVPGETDSYIQAGNYIPGNSGWIIRGDGFAEFRDLAADIIGAEQLIAASVQATHIDVSAITADRLTVGNRHSDSVLINSTFEDPGIESGVENWNAFGGWQVINPVGLGAEMVQETVNPISGSRSMRLNFPDGNSGVTIASTVSHPVIEGQRWQVSVRMRETISIDKSLIPDDYVYKLWIHTSNEDNVDPLSPVTIESVDADGYPYFHNADESVIWREITNLEVTDAFTIEDLNGIAAIPSGHKRLMVSIEILPSRSTAWSVVLDDFRCYYNIEGVEIYNEAGNIVASIDNDGRIFGSTIEYSDQFIVSSDTFIIDGSPLSESLTTTDAEVINDMTIGGQLSAESLVLGGVPMEYKVVFYGNINTGQSSNDGTSPVWTFAEAKIRMKAGHAYRFSYRFFARAQEPNQYFASYMVRRTGSGYASALDPTFTQSRMRHVVPYTSNRGICFTNVFWARPTEDVQYTVGLCIDEHNANIVIDNTVSDTVLIVEDMGVAQYSASVLVQRNSGGIEQPAPDAPSGSGGTTSKHTKTFNATWSRGYNGGGGQISSGNNQDQGYYSGTNGNTKSAIGFDDAAIRNTLDGAEIIKVELYLYFNHWYYNGGGTAILGTHGAIASTGATTWGDIALKDPDQIRSGNWPKPGGRWVDVTGWGGGFKGGNNKGVLVGPGASTSKQYYGTFNGASQNNTPKLRFTYRK